MNLSDDQLACLRCPVTGSRLALADDALLARVNAAIAGGRVLTRISAVVREPLDAALVNADRSLLYPLREGMVCLLASEALEIWEFHEPQ